MEAILSEPTLWPGSVGVTIMGATAVATMIKQYEGKTYLFAANPSIYAVDLPIRLASAQFPNPTIALLPERLPVPFQDGFFTVRLDRERAEIYEIDPGAPDDPQDPTCKANTCPSVSPDASPGSKLTSNAP